MALRSGAKRCSPVKVVTMDADLELQIPESVEEDALGRDLFDLVCRTIGLREIWYFGLEYQSDKGHVQWLQMGPKVCKQNVSKCDGAYQFHFLAKYYPERVEEELIQDTTIHLFFLQVWESIVSSGVYCPAEASILLASYAVQAKAGDCSDTADLEPNTLLPSTVIAQYHMTPLMWLQRIRTWWMNNKGLSREEAELEYLKIAQDLDQYGTHFFRIFNKKDSSLWLGVCATGIHIYTQDNRLVPEIRFQWKEILNISYRSKKLMIKVMDESREGKTKLWTAWTESTAACQVVLDLCVGSHNLYLTRRKKDSVEVQAMKAQAQEQRERREAERARLEAEVAEREAVEEERDALRLQLEEAQAQLRAQSEILARTEGTAHLLAEKARLSEEEILALTKRAAEAEAEAHRLGLSNIKTCEEKLVMERKAREAELIAQRLLDDSERRLQNPLYSTNNNLRLLRYDPPDPPLSPSSQDIRHLSAQIEKERLEYAEKSRHLQDQLSELRTEIEGLKVEESDSNLDRIYLENQRQGQTKYASLRKSSSGTTKARIDAFDGL